MVERARELIFFFFLCCALQLIRPIVFPLIDGALSNAELDAFAKDTNGDVVRKIDSMDSGTLQGQDFFFFCRGAKEKTNKK